MSITNLSQNDKFRSWLNKINEIIETLNKTVNDLLGKAPTMHSSSDATYGIGDATNYGHIILSDSINSTSDTTKGVAATPYAVKEAYDKAQTALSLAESNNSANGSNGEILSQVQTELANKAPTKHSSSQPTYGVASNNEYGHVKLTTNINSDSDTTSGIAVAPLAVKTINDKVISLTEELLNKSDTPHNSESNVYGVGDETKYGHVKLSDNVALNLKATDGVAATIGSVKVAYDLADKADTNATLAMAELQLKSPKNHASPEITYGLGNSTNYGHVKITDEVDLESYAVNGIVPSASALRETYLRANQAYDLATELQNSGVGGGLTTKQITNEDLNGVITNGIYITNIPSTSLNYPYDDSCISVLEVSMVGKTDVKQRLYSNNALYIRDSFDGGSSWSEWLLVSKSFGGQANLYVSLEFGDDRNSGYSSDTPVKSIDRLLEIINIQSIFASTEKDTHNVKVFFDKGEYTDITTFSSLPMNVQFTSYYHEREGDDVNSAELVENRPYFPSLYIINSRISLSGLKVDILRAQENSTIVIESNDYMSVGHIESNTGSTIYISSLYPTAEDVSVPLIIHNTDPEDSIFSASNYGRICDEFNREILFEDIIEKSYIFDCSFYGEITLPNITFSNNSTISMSQYILLSYGSLTMPATMIGDPTNNVIEANTRLQGVLWGGGSSSQYLRADGKWMSIPNPKGDGAKTKYLRDDGSWQTPPDTNTTYTASNGIKLTGTNFTNTGVTSFNGSTGAVTYSAPVTSVNGLTGAVTVSGGGMPNYKAGVAKSLNTTYTAEQDGFILYLCAHPDDATNTSLVINGVTYAFNYSTTSTERGNQGGLHQFAIPKGITYRANNYGTLTWYPCL